MHKKSVTKKKKKKVERDSVTVTKHWLCRKNVTKSVTFVTLFFFFFVENEIALFSRPRDFVFDKKKKK